MIELLTYYVIGGALIIGPPAIFLIIAMMGAIQNTKGRMVGYKDHKDIVKLFLDHSDRNIEFNILDKYGRTPFMLACRKGHKDIVKLLLEHSNVIDINFPDSFNLSKKVKKLIWTHFISIGLIDDDKPPRKRRKITRK